MVDGRLAAEMNSVKRIVKASGPSDIEINNKGVKGEIGAATSRAKREARKKKQLDLIGFIKSSIDR